MSAGVHSITEPSPSNAPGVYRILLDTTETNGSYVSWVVRDTSNVIVEFGSEQIIPEPAFAMFGTPTAQADIDARTGFLNAIADHVLRRRACTAEDSTEGDTLTVLSLLGMVLLNMNGQKIQGPDSNGNYFLPVKGCNGTLASIPVSVSGGKVLGTDPCADIDDCGCQECP